MLEIGTVVFGNWAVESEIGSGAFGTVYKIKREDFGEEYFAAMKVIRIPQDKGDKNRLYSEGMDDEDISLYYKQIAGDFIKEIKLLSSLDGVTNIVDYKDHVIEPNDDLGYTIYIKMQLLTPVSKLLVGEGNKANFLSNEEILKLGKDMCSALEVCEKKRIIHRDIKIDNIFFSENGDYKLGDFGIARQLEATQGEMSKKGTLLYMAPEVFKGEKYDRTADIYSLGVVLYRLLNKNRAPFFPDYPNPIKLTDKENANAKRLKGDEFPDIAGISAELNAVLKKACAFNPRDRYQSAEDFKVALEGVREDIIAPVVIPPVETVVEDEKTADEATVGIFDTAADVPVSDNTETEAVSDVIEADEIVNNPSFDGSDFTATQAIFANEILSDTIFEKETVTLVEPDEKTESAISEAEEDKEKENKESKEPKEPKKDEKKKKGAVIIIIALILLIAIGVGIFFAVKHFSGKKDGSKPSTSTTQESSTDGAVVQSTDTNETTSPGTTESESIPNGIPITIADNNNVEDQSQLDDGTPYLNSSGYYELCTADDLFWFAKEVNSGNNDINAILKNNINLNNRDWMPIGQDYITPYCGGFNGNGYKVSGLHCNRPNSDCVGFFGFSEGTISNLSISGSVTGNNYVGGVVGNNFGKVNACTNSGDATGNIYVGGVVGNNCGTVDTCTNSGDVSGSDNVGGVVGDNSGTVESCTNSGDVSGSDKVGGVVGYNYETVESCTNNGDVFGSFVVGGVVGYNYDTVDTCTNSGDINGDTSSFVGGVVGDNNYGTISNCTYYTYSADYGIGWCWEHDQNNCTSHGVTAN